MDENNEIEAICYQPNLTEKQLCTSVFYKKALNYVSDTGLNIFHIQAQAGNMLLIKFLLITNITRLPLILRPECKDPLELRFVELYLP